MSNETNGTNRKMSEIPVEKVDGDIIDPSGSYDYEFGQLFFNVDPERNRLNVKTTETRSVDIRQIFEFISKNVQYIRVKDGRVTQISKTTAKDMLDKKATPNKTTTRKKEVSKKTVLKSKSASEETQKPKTVKKVVKKRKTDNTEKDR